MYEVNPTDKEVIFLMFTYPNIINQVQQWHKGRDHLDQLKVSQFRYECVEVKAPAFEARERSHTDRSAADGHVLQTKNKL